MELESGWRGDGWRLKVKSGVWEDRREEKSVKLHISCAFVSLLFFWYSLKGIIKDNNCFCFSFFTLFFRIILLMKKTVFFTEAIFYVLHRTAISFWSFYPFSAAINFLSVREICVMLCMSDTTIRFSKSSADTDKPVQQKWWFWWRWWVSGEGGNCLQILTNTYY